VAALLYILLLSCVCSL